MAWERERHGPMGRKKVRRSGRSWDRSRDNILCQLKMHTQDMREGRVRKIETRVRREKRAKKRWEFIGLIINAS